MNLYEYTTAAHHGAETSKLGGLLTSGTVSRQQWANWLHSELCLRENMDVFLPQSMRRSADLTMDLLSMGDVKSNIIDTEFVWSIVVKTRNVQYLGGLLYIIGGANLRGGAVIRKTLEPLGFPCRHLHWNPDEAFHADRWLKELREFSWLGDAANEAFKDVVAVMDACV